MKKLYAKSELAFSILWIVIYVLGTSIAEAVSDKIASPKSIPFALHAALSVVLLIWIIKNKHTNAYGLCKTDIKAADFLYYLPFAALVSVNLFFGFDTAKPIPEMLFGCGSMLCVGFLEEIIFRGFLFKAMAKDNLKAAVIVSSVTFGIGHIINLFTGSAQLLPTLCQILYATAFGFLCVTVFHRGKTLLPCIVTHSAVNALSVFTNSPKTTVQTIASALALFVIAAAYTLYLRKKLPDREAEIEK